jgi:rhamnosyltransferase
MTNQIESYALILPTRNAAPYLDKLLPALAAQTLPPAEFLVVDSQSRDDTAARLRAFGARVEVIEARQFNHGGTRRWASAQVKSDILVYLVQDAIPHPDAFSRLVNAIASDPALGMAYGRQLPHPEASLLAAQARYFNYPEESRNKCLADAPRLGIKTCFCSDAFCAYRRSALEAVGGFPEDVIGSEDIHVAARMLLAKWIVRYEALACVTHSHNYRLSEEFRRYFDIGVFYGREPWIRQTFGFAEKEGRRYVMAEARAAKKAGAWQKIPEICVRTLLKFLAYRLGYQERYLPIPFKKAISMYSAYWR